jgi:hypothetical protein
MPLIPTDLAVETPSRHVLVDQESKQKPHTVALLCDWQYIERSIHRLIAAWGREVSGWEDKSTIHRHVWDQAECVRRLRERIAQFPGGKADAPVSAELEHLANKVLLAPTVQDALDGVYVHLLKTLVSAYADYVASVQPVHDAPTISLLHEINQIKSQQWLWYRDYRRRYPHTTNAAYLEKIEIALSECGHFRSALPIKDDAIAKPAGLATDFKLARFSARDEPIKPKYPLMDYMRADFTRSIETRRLFWAYAYMLEKNLPDSQLIWIYDGHYMPWEWHHDISRHLWDESRHGDSGNSRLKDFGISLDEVGFSTYEQDEREEILQSYSKEKGVALDEAYANQRDILVPFKMDHMTKEELYENVFFIGMCAETGHFVVKNESYVDFKEGQDLESAEMMLFDIIDETAHVQYAHRWLPLLAEHAGVDNSNYRERAAAKLRETEAESARLAAEFDAKLSRTPGDPAFDFYQDLLARIRDMTPLSNATSCPPRTQKPM